MTPPPDYALPHISNSLTSFFANGRMLLFNTFHGGDTLLKEFRDFAMRGNVVDLAIGVIIGGAFGLIVNSLVADIFMPIIGVITGGVNFADLAYPLKAATVDAAGKEVPAVVI